MKSISDKELCRLLEQRNWVLNRINGSHHIYTKVGNPARISVPVHGNQSLKVGKPTRCSMIAEKKPRIGPKVPAKVPEYMICEIMDGKPLYYKGYRDVLSGRKTFGEIVGSSRLQSFIVAYLMRVFSRQLDDTAFVVFCNELGLHLDRGSNLSGDIVIYEAATMPPEAINEYYSDIPAKVCIEVDISIDTADMAEGTYIYKKTQKLLSFGMEKVIWITTPTQKITIATAGQPWQVIDWNQEIDIIEGVTVNIGKYLADRGIVVN